ncbi:putative membrane protein [Pontibacter aydingkolensis]|uniref:DUF2254 domain-containing protein n=1 Tax=Pontibacter aydingkolensis TaxID=1911536 RepID=A0ABS7CZR0_9BACT|nr:DUF2254 domain-containing protein [Pontibacter aydingkolensis]MBW7469303.1 DUF2254 domain-containing protein [Pontibacter aydingkolensis]
MDFAKLIHSIKKTYIQVIRSIAFYPIMISLGLFLLALGTTYLDRISVGGSIIDKMPFLKIDDENTARSLLSSLLTGLITLVTFTFAMVMIVLTQVTSSFSPRLLPDLVSKKGSQVVLGTIIGTAGFIIVVLSNIQTMPSGPKVPLLSVAISMYLGFACLIAFIYFIHKISNEVQIGNILSNIYHTTRYVLDRELRSGSYHENWEEGEKFHLVKAWDSGYFDTITSEEFLKASRKTGMKLRVLVEQGTYLLKGEPFLEINKPMNQEIQQILEENVIFRHKENIKENFLYSFKHLTEVAVKALSPGINDPGTAIHAIDYLLDLLCRLQELRGQKVVTHKDGTAAIIYAPVRFEKIFYFCTSSIRAYSSQDVAVQAKLINLIAKVSKRDEEDKHKSLLEKELSSIEEASAQEMKSQHDIAYIKALIQQARAKYMAGNLSANKQV